MYARTSPLRVGSAQRGEAAGARRSRSERHAVLRRAACGAASGGKRGGRAAGAWRERRGHGGSRDGAQAASGLGKPLGGLGRGGGQAASGLGKPLRGLGGRVRGRVGVSLARVRP